MRKPFKPLFLALSFTAISLSTTALADSLALLITNTEYPDTVVGAGPSQEHTLLLNAYRAQGFTVVAGRDLNANNMREAITKFYEQADDKDRLVIHFTGRAVNAGGQSWLLPVDTPADSRVTVEYEGLPLTLALDLLSAEPGHAALFFADIGGSTDAPFSPGIGDVQIPQGVLMVSGPQGLLNDFVMNDLLVSAKPLSEALASAGSALQVEGFVSPDVALVPVPPAAAETSANWIDLLAEQTLWAVADKSGKAADLEEYLRRFPDGIFATTARARLEALATPPEPTPEDIEKALRLTRAARKDIQRDLTVLGYDTRGIDGLFGRGTRGAISDWQEDQGLEHTGYLDAGQIANLAAQGDARRAAIARDDNFYWNATGLSGRKSDLELYLDRYPDGLHSADARTALAEIVAAEREAADTEAWTAAVGENTADSYRAYLADFPDGLYADIARARVEALDPIPAEPDPLDTARATEARLGLNPATRLLIESRLKGLGFNPGIVDGNFTATTRNAIRAYQGSKGLNQTGYVDPATVRALLLG